jgi:glycosyl transferase family 25
MRIHVINLDRSPDRLWSFREINKGLQDVERSPAVDGNSLSNNDLLADGTLLQAPPIKYSPGAIGCALSHAGLWKKAIDDGRPITICDDDAIFNKNFAVKSKALLSKLDRDWDFVLWGWNFDAPLLIDPLPGVSPCVLRFNLTSLRENVDIFQKSSINTQPVRLLQCIGVPCYSVTPNGARKLREACIPIRDAKIFFPGLNRELSNFGIDVMMNAVYRNIRAYAAFPPLVATRNEGSTTQRPIRT